MIYNEDLRGTSVSLFYAGISSTADVQGRDLCPGSTPGAPLQKQESEVSLNDKKTENICR